MPIDVLLGGMFFFLDFLSKMCSLQSGPDLPVGHQASQIRATAAFSLQPSRSQEQTWATPCARDREEPVFWRSWCKIPAWWDADNGELVRAMLWLPEASVLSWCELQGRAVSESARLETVLLSTVLLSDGAFPSSVLISM